MNTIHAIDLVRQRPGDAKRDYVRRLATAVLSFGAWLNHCLARRRSRLDLLELTDHQLKDIGISRCDAHREGMRRFWD